MTTPKDRPSGYLNSARVLFPHLFRGLPADPVQRARFVERVLAKPVPMFHRRQAT